MVVGCCCCYVALFSKFSYPLQPFSGVFFDFILHQAINFPLIQHLKQKIVLLRIEFLHKLLPANRWSFQVVGPRSRRGGILSNAIQINMHEAKIERQWRRSSTLSQWESFGKDFFHLLLLRFIMNDKYFGTQCIGYSTACLYTTYVGMVEKQRGRQRKSERVSN